MSGGPLSNSAPGAPPEPVTPVTVAAPVTLAPDLVVAERFRLVRALGGGGMGAVWLAQHTELDTPCALKFMHEEAARSPEIAARFKREARAAAQLRSPHVVQILDHGTWQGLPYIAMELLEGEDLSKRLKRVRPLPPREVVKIAAEVGRALAKAHAAGLVHRDLKPANIFLVRDDDREITKVLDFGVAKVTGGSVLEEAHTTTGAVLGTPFYMSPEQLRGGRELDHRADLWSLSVVVFQCLTGRLPFRADLLAELVVKIMVDPIPVPSQVAPEVGLPAAFDAWWARAADRDLARRFQTAKELTEALALALDLSLAGSLGSSTDPGSRARLVGVGGVAGVAGAPGMANAPPVEELDSGLLRTAMPTVTPSPASGSVHLTLPPELRRASPWRLLVPAGVLLAAGAVAVVVFSGRTPSPADGDRASAVSAASAAPAAAPSTASTVREGEPPAISATPVVTAPPSATPRPTPSASASAAPAAKAPATLRPAAPPAQPSPRVAPKPKGKHEGVTDF